MLLELSIRDFAIIDRLKLTFGPGLHVFTGETGAGKSIIIDALSLVLGDRASTELIRGSREEARVEALFDISRLASMADIFEEAGIAAGDDLIIKRVIQRSGRNKVYINGSLATLVTLTEVGRRLVDIYGQSEHQSLTRPEEHIEVLDSFGAYSDLRAGMHDAYRNWASRKSELDGLIQDAESARERRDLLGFQSKEIEDAELKPGEDEVLKREKEKLQNSERIRTVTDEAQRLIYSDTGSMTEKLGALLKELKEVSRFDPALEKTVKTLEESLYQLEDASSFLRDYSGTVEFYPAALEEIDNRLDLINTLKRKYNGAIEEILKKKEEFDRELESIESHDQRVEDLTSLVKEARDRAVINANRLTEERKKAAARLKEKKEKELAGLGMEGSVFEVLIESELNPDKSTRFTEKGADRVSFLISTNPGEEVKNLSRVASGGELSRIMLALKSIIAAGRVPTLIFDEVDSGVGGRMAHVVGQKLKAVSKANQVICITHLPQIAAFADSHYFVSKSQTPEGRTVTSVKKLDREERLEDISRMLGGRTISDATRKHARELLKAARSF